MFRWMCTVLIAGIFSPLSLPATAASDKLTPLALDQVQVAGELGRRIQITVENSLLNLDVDTLFLRPFREKKTKSGYTGLGMLIDASVRLAVHTGDSRVLALKNHLVKTLLDSQEPNGYLGEFDRAHRLWAFVDVQELAYLIQGLLADYRYFRDERSLAAARKQADHLMKHWSERPEDWLDKMGMTFHMTTTGVERAIYPFFAHTGDPQYREFCVREMGVPTWNFPIVVGRHRPQEGHVYAYMSRCLAQLEWYRDDPDPALLTSTRRALDFILHGNGMVVTGGCSDHECWHDTQTGTVNLTETCALVYVLKVLDNLLQLEGNPLYGDIMERAIYNALFSVQSPEGRRLRYYTPFDGPRSYYPKDTYCCPNNYRRSMGHLPEWIYYRSADGVTVNLYSASSTRVKLENGAPVSITQETDYPNSGTVKLRIDPDQAGEFSIRLRIPRWCAHAEISVNGESLRDTIRRGTFHALRRTWKQGDRIELRLPMPWRFVKGRQAQAGKVAILRGPVVFGLDPSQDKQLQGILLGTITLDTSSIEGPLPDATVRPDGMACKIRAWKPGAWYPRAKPVLELRLTELPDPKSQSIYFHVPNPLAKELSHDEIFGEVPNEELSEDDLIGRP
jgi:hypothetical protein